MEIKKLEIRWLEVCEEGSLTKKRDAKCVSKISSSKITPTKA